MIENVKFSDLIMKEVYILSSAPSSCVHDFGVVDGIVVGREIAMKSTRDIRTFPWMK